jgi:hypothetical protein
LAALMAQAGLRADAAREAIRAGGIVDADTGAVPNARFGWGRLSAAGALGATAGGSPPTLSLEAVPVLPGAAATLHVTATDADGNASALRLKWDDDYDGTWDTAWGPVADRQVTNDQAGSRLFKARVRDAKGLVAEGVRTVVVDARFVKPLDETLIAELAAQAGRVVTVEEGCLPGGFGSAVLEALAARGLAVQVRRLGLPDRFVAHGNADGQRAAFGLDAAGIARAVRELCAPPDEAPAPTPAGVRAGGQAG